MGGAIPSGSFGRGRRIHRRARNDYGQLFPGSLYSAELTAGTGRVLHRNTGRYVTNFDVNSKAKCTNVQVHVSLSKRDIYERVKS